MGELTGIKDLQALNLSGSYPRKPHTAPLNCTKPLQPTTYFQDIACSMSVFVTTAFSVRMNWELLLLYKLLLNSEEL